MILRVAEDTTITDKNMSSLVSLGEISLALDHVVMAQLRLTGLDGSAANITMKLRRKADEVVIGDIAEVVAKPATADTVFFHSFDPIFVAAGDDLEILASSSDAKDTAVDGLIEWISMDSTIAPTGSTLTITFTDSNDAVVPGATYSITNGTSGDTNLGAADGNGQSAIVVTDATYTIRAYPTRGVTFAEDTVVVNSTTTKTVKGATALTTTGGSPTGTAIYDSAYNIVGYANA